MSNSNFRTAPADNTRASSPNPGREAAIDHAHNSSGSRVRNDVARATILAVVAPAPPKVTVARIGVFTAVSLHQNCQSCHSYVNRPPKEPPYKMKKVPLPESSTSDEDDDE